MLRTRLKIATLLKPSVVCAEHLPKGYQYRTVDALASHVSIEPALPHHLCEIHTYAGVCRQKGAWKLTYWQIERTVRETFTQSVQERLV